MPSQLLMPRYVHYQFIPKQTIFIQTAHALETADSLPIQTPLIKTGFSNPYFIRQAFTVKEINENNTSGNKNNRLFCFSLGYFRL